MLCDRHELYNLKSFVVHLGDAADSGHYIALAKHADQWFLYDDAVRTKALDAQLSTTALYNKQAIKTYILFHERQ